MKNKSILEEFARGNISPNVGSIRRGTHYDRTMKALVENENKLTEGLVEELQDTMKQYIDLQAEANLISTTDSFIYGYRLGVLMTMEVFNGNDNAIFGRAE